MSIRGFAIRPVVLIAALAAAAALAGCRDDATSGPRWTGSFTRAITTCGGSMASFALDPPRDAVVESEGVFEAGSRVALFLGDDSCSFAGTIAPDGRLEAQLHPGCPGAGDRTSIVIEDVFAAATVIHQTTDHTDPQLCDVEVWGTFDRE